MIDASAITVVDTQRSSYRSLNDRAVVSDLPFGSSLERKVLIFQCC